MATDTPETIREISFARQACATYELIKRLRWELQCILKHHHGNSDFDAYAIDLGLLDAMIKEAGYP